MTHDLHQPVELSRGFVLHWVSQYDQRPPVGTTNQVEQEIRTWLRGLPEPKYLDMEHFLRLGNWKTVRQRPNYKVNSPTTVEDLTRQAYQVEDAEKKLRILMHLRGVGVAVASTILHYLHPDQFPIFDVRVRRTLKRAKLWPRSVEYASVRTWLLYVCIMRDLAKKLGVSLRELDKALWAYDSGTHSIL